MHGHCARSHPHTRTHRDVHGARAASKTATTADVRRHRGATRNPQVPEVDGVPDSQATVSAPRQRSSARDCRRKVSLPVQRRPRAADCMRGTPRRTVPRRQLLCNARKTPNDICEGLAAGASTSWGASRDLTKDRPPWVEQNTQRRSATTVGSSSSNHTRV